MRGKSIFLAAALVFALGVASAVAADGFHFALSRSAPEADATVSSPEEVRLWFTQAPQDSSVGIRLIDAGGQVVETTEPATDADSPTVYFVKPSVALSDGAYTVSWRGIGEDGHVVRGEFGFAVSAQ